MNADEGRQSTLTLELVPLDAALPAGAIRPPEPVAPVPDAGRIRDAYLRARFPGVIRSPADLADADRVIDAVGCYVDDGRLDRARELAGLALASHPELEAFRQARWEATEPPGETALANPAREHAARIHRLLTTQGAGRLRGH